MMEKLMSYTMVALFTTIAVSIAATPDKAVMEAKEKAAWQAFEDKNVDEFKKLLSPAMAAIYAEGPSDFQGELASMKENTLKSFAISEFKATSPDSDTIITTYKVAYEATSDGKDTFGTEYAASVWRRMGGEWKMIFRTDMKAQTAAK
jgi:hypothetical protein